MGRITVITTTVAALIVMGGAGVAVFESYKVKLIDQQNKELQVRLDSSKKSDLETAHLLRENENLLNEKSVLKKQLLEQKKSPPTQPDLKPLPSKVIKAKIFTPKGEIDDEIVKVLELNSEEKAKLSYVFKASQSNIEQLIKSKISVKESSKDKVVLKVLPYYSEALEIKKNLRPMVENILGPERTSILYDIGTRTGYFCYANLFNFDKEDLKEVTITLNKNEDGWIHKSISTRYAYGMFGSGQRVTGSSWDPRKGRSQLHYRPAVGFFDDWLPENMK